MIWAKELLALLDKFTYPETVVSYLWKLGPSIIQSIIANNEEQLLPPIIIKSIVFSYCNNS